NTRVASIVKHKEETNAATYYFASDHLGSSSVLTTNTGSYHERIEYLPYGEVWVEDAANSSGYTTPYKFTGKELDKETNLYYFGARYYDARLSRWLSADPALNEYLPTGNKDKDKNLPGMGGVYNAFNLNVYHYSKQNPVIYIDPDGRLVGVDDFLGWAVGSIMGIRNDSFLSGVKQNFIETWSLVGGTLNTFYGAKSFMDYIKGFGELALRLTWNLPNELMGLAAGYGAIQIGGAITEMWENVQMVKLNSFFESAFTIGSKVIGDKGFLSEMDKRKHEQGHYYQSLLLGPLYMGVIGIPSVTHNWIWNLYGKSWEYYDFYTEKWADRWGGVPR
ncbi:MAG: RHS repeat-associated core domain-containing protein, partial [Spirochaetota bacterium]